MKDNLLDHLVTLCDGCSVLESNVTLFELSLSSGIAEFRTCKISGAHSIPYFVVSGMGRLIRRSWEVRKLADCSRSVYVAAVLSSSKSLPPPYLPRHGYNLLCHSGRYCASIHFSSPPICLSRSSKKKRHPLSSWSKTVANNRKSTGLP